MAVQILYGCKAFSYISPAGICMGIMFELSLYDDFFIFILEWMNTIKVYNKEVLHAAVGERPKDQPLITVSNHRSCIDDPVLWGM